MNDIVRSEILANYYYCYYYCYFNVQREESPNVHVRSKRRKFQFYSYAPMELFIYQSINGFSCIVHYNKKNNEKMFIFMSNNFLVTSSYTQSHSSIHTHMEIRTKSNPWKTPLIQHDRLRIGAQLKCRIIVSV